MRLKHSLGQTVAGTGTKYDFSGTWKNELDSQMKLQQDGDKLTGEYESAVSDDNTKTTGSLIGSVDGTLISFLVHWHDFQAITSWVGRFDGGKLNTLWQMVHLTESGKEWESISSGADEFTKA